MEKTEATAILGITIDSSASEIEEAYDRRMGEVRKRFDAARGMSMRAQYKREFAAIREARQSLLSDLDENPRTQQPVEEQPGEERRMGEPVREEPSVRERSVEERIVEERPVEEPGVEERSIEAPVVEERSVEEPVVKERSVEEPFDEERSVEESSVEEPSEELPLVSESVTEGSGVKRAVRLLDLDESAEVPSPSVRATGKMRPGELFASRFELQRELENEDTGAVWLVHDHSVRRQSGQVALLFLPDFIVSDKAAFEKLKNQVRRRMASTIPNVARLYELVENEGAVAILVEYIDGQSLTRLRLNKANQIFEARDLKHWVKELCGALESAHKDFGLIEGDIVPDNLIVDRAGSLKMKDFAVKSCTTGSIKRPPGAPGQNRMLPYQSPQRAAGEEPALTDDLYSLGATLYELLTSRPPFYVGDIGLQISAQIPPSMTKRRVELGVKGEPIPESWEETVAACLAKDPFRRPHSATEVARRLEEVRSIPDSTTKSTVVSDEKVIPVPVPVPIPKPEPPILAPSKRKHRLAIFGIAFILVSAVAIAFYSFHYLTGHKLGRIVLNSIPAKAHVFLDGVSLGTTPLVLEDVAPGDRRLRIEFRGYEPEKLVISVKPGDRESSLLFRLVPTKEPSPRPTVQPSPSGSSGTENSQAVASPSPMVSPTTSPKVSPTSSPQMSATPSPLISATPSPQVSATPSAQGSPTTSQKETAGGNEKESSHPSPTPLSQEELDAVKEEVVNRINALPRVTAEAKRNLIEKLHKARSMERLAVIPFGFGQTVLRRSAVDALVKTFNRPELRDKLKDPTIILVIAGYADIGGRPGRNLRISRARAEQVGQILKGRANLYNAMETIGMGGTELLDRRRRGQNRAVEVWAIVPRLEGEQ